jgi:glycosyltransferase involved in cell wall biosynthesis
MQRYLLVEPNLRSFGVLEEPGLALFTERHHFRLSAVPLTAASSIAAEIGAHDEAGVIFSLTTGLPSRRQLQLAGYALRRSRRVFLHWPYEEAIEVIDRERLGSLWRHWAAYNATVRLSQVRARLRQLSVIRAVKQWRYTSYQRRQLNGNLQFLSVDFGNTRTHLLGGIEWMRHLDGSIEQVQAQLRGVRDRLKHGMPPIRDRSDASGSMSAQEVASGWNMIVAEIDGVCNNLAQVRSTVDRIQGHLDGGKVGLDRAGALVEALQRSAVTQVPAIPPYMKSSSFAGAADRLPAVRTYRASLADFRGRIRPVSFLNLGRAPTPEAPLRGTGVYVRTDYWAQLVSGGSYGHTCYVAKELARVTEKFTCLMGSRYPMLEEMGITQEMITPPLVGSSELDLFTADRFYYDALRSRLEALRPAYIYERLCQGNFAVARLSRDLDIPYILEYNGSEVAMRRSFGSGDYEQEGLFLEAEELAFRQATVITSISEHVHNDVVARSGNSLKVLVNPNGVDCDEYAPAKPDERRSIRASLGLPDGAPVIGFIGTFGGWHGIDVLAEALPQICRGAPEVRFLLIGDGNLKPKILDVIVQYGLHGQVVDVGRTEQREGARILKAADIFVSPHSSHMRDTPFFGSPTKLFEYMALGGGIVASDLEQIGVVMSPALRPADFARNSVTVRDERGVLCKPGDVGDFVSGVLALVRHRDVAEALGRNAREAALREFSWARHVARIWDHIESSSNAEYPQEAPRAVG